MERRYSVVCDSEVASRVDALAHEYDITTQQVLEQLIALGLEEIEFDD